MTDHSGDRSGILPLQPNPRLATLLDPKSIAVVGASANWARAGARVLRFIVEGGYEGDVYPVNPGRAELAGLTCYPSLDALPAAPDLAILAVSAAQTAETVTQLGRVGGKAAICMAAGFREAGPDGGRLEADLQAAARAAGVTVLGPNSVGFRNTAKNLYAVFATDVALGPLPGSIAVVSQSGGLAGYLGAAVGKARGVGYKWIIDTGNEIDVDVADCIAYLAGDDEVSVIGFITEGCQDGSRLRGALEAAHRADKPVVAFKIGRSAAGARAAASHTGALAGSDAVYDAVFRQHGVHRVEDEHEFIETLSLYANAHAPRGPNVCVFSLSGGVATLLVDLCAQYGLEVPALDPIADPEAARALPSARFDNPLDLSGQIGSEPHVLKIVIDHVMSQPQIDSVIFGFAYMLQAEHICEVFVPTLVEAAHRYDKPMVVVGLATPKAEATLRANGIIVEPMAVDAVRAVAAASPGRHTGPQREPAPALPTAGGTPEGIVEGLEAARHLPGVRFVESYIVTSAAEALEAAESIGWPVALKVEGGDSPHKTELGLVVTGLSTPAELRDAYVEVRSRAAGLDVGHTIVQPMLRGVEMALGLHDDPTFGPVVMVGLGGIYVEVLEDVALGVPPINHDTARAMVQSLRGYPLLSGARGKPAASVDDLVAAVVALSDFARAEGDHLVAVDINPFIVATEPGRSAAVDLVVAWKGDRRGAIGN